MLTLRTLASAPLASVTAWDEKASPMTTSSAAVGLAPPTQLASTFHAPADTSDLHVFVAAEAAEGTATAARRATAARAMFRMMDRVSPRPVPEARAGPRPTGGLRGPMGSVPAHDHRLDEPLAGRRQAQHEPQVAG